MSFVSLHPWLLAIRPKTLPAGAAPVLMAGAMAFGDGVHHLPSFFAALAGALLIQIGTNLANDYFDWHKGTDTAERLGPVRVTQAGLLPPGVVLAGAMACFAAAIGVAVYLTLRAGPPLAVIAAISVVCGFLYTAGPCPLGYVGLGEVFVLIFFGPVAVAGTYYAQSLEMNGAVILAGLAPGMFSSAILAVNNLRDIDNDRASNKRTLAVRFGRDFARKEYFLLVIGGSLVPVAVFFLTRDYVFTLLATAAAPLAWPGVRDVLGEGGPGLNRTLAFTGQLLLIYTFLFSLGWSLNL